jgi:hypothetical protein
LHRLEHRSLQPHLINSLQALEASGRVVQIGDIDSFSCFHPNSSNEYSGSILSVAQIQKLKIKSNILYHLKFDNLLKLKYLLEVIQYYMYHLFDPKSSNRKKKFNYLLCNVALLTYCSKAFFVGGMHSTERPFFVKRYRRHSFTPTHVLVTSYSKATNLSI